MSCPNKRKRSPVPGTGRNGLRRKHRKRLGNIYEAVIEQGWSIRDTGSGHLVFERPDGKAFFHSSTPRTDRAVKKLGAQLRRAGLLV